MALPTKKIPQLTDYGAPLQGTEEVELSAVGTSRRTTARAFVLPGVDSVITATPMGVPGTRARQLASSATILVNDGGPGGLITLTALAPAGSPPNLQSLIAAAGNNNNVVLGPLLIGMLDVDTTAGAASLTGLVAQFDGQVVTISNITAALLTLTANSVASLAANRFRLPANIGVVQNGSYTLRYSAAISRWVALS